MVNRDALIKQLYKLDDEAFAWLVLCITGDRQPQIWPDGTGGFVDSAGISKTKIAAKKWIKEYGS